MQDIKYRDALKNAASLKKLGMTVIYLSRDNDEKPWEHVVKVDPGGGRRLDMDTSIWFTAEDPKTKIRFRWSFEIEERSANGKGHYQIAVESCKAVFGKLNGKAKKQLADHFKACAEKVRAKGVEWQSYADRQKRDSETLELLGASR